MGHNESSLRAKFIVLSAFRKSVERSYRNDLAAHLKALEQKEAGTPKRSSRWQEITKLRNEINKVERKKTIQRSNKTKNWFFEKNQQNR